MKRKASGSANNETVKWEDIICPICMEHPHNAVILRCSSYRNGCRSYVCDSGYKHSNCLDRFVEQTAGVTRRHSLNNSGYWISSDVADLAVRDGVEPLHINENLNHNETDTVASVQIPRDSEDNNLNQDTQPDISQPSWARIAPEIYSTHISCPICRGTVTGWEIADEGRKHLNLLNRSCCHDDCSFSGNYREMRQHVRTDHVRSNPVNVDPTRVQSWLRLGGQREHDDIVTAIHSATPGAIVLGDYAIERGGSQLEQDGNGGELLWPDTLFILHMIDSLFHVTSRQSRPWSRHQRLGAPSSNHQRLLWGENLLGLQDGEPDPDYAVYLNSINENPPPVRRSRRRRNGSGSE